MTAQKRAYPHVSPLLANSTGGRVIVHMLDPEAKAAVCNGSLTKYKLVRKVRVQILYDVDEPITCKVCRQVLEAICRDRLKLLTAPQLEQFLIDTNDLVFKDKEHDGKVFTAADQT